MSELWLKQSWDTAASFKGFQLYLKHRKMWPAYAEHKGYDGDIRGKRAPGSWRNWAEGRTQKGKHIPEAIGWTARALAWDSHLAAIAAKEAETKHLADIEEYRTTMATLAQANMQNAMKIITIVGSELDSLLDKLQEGTSEGLNANQIPPWLRAANDAIEKTAGAWAQSLSLAELLESFDNE